VSHIDICYFSIIPQRHHLPINIYSDSKIKEQASPVLLFMGQALSGLITVLEDKEYMVTLREKMNNIKKVAKFYNYDLLLAKK